MENSENNELTIRSSEVLENNNNNEDDTHILIDEPTSKILNNIFYKSNFNINFTKSLLCKLLMIQEAEDGSDSYSDETFNELYKKINSFSENAECVLESYNTFYDDKKKMKMRMHQIYNKLD